MVNISNNQNQRVSVSTSNNNSVSASSPKANDVNAGTNANAQLARSWAIGEGLIQGEDYSSKYYAGKAKESADIAASAIQDIGTAKEEAIEDITDAKTDADIIDQVPFIPTGSTVEISVPPNITDSIPVPEGKKFKDYRHALKACNAENNIEHTLLIGDTEVGTEYKLRMYRKQSEGTPTP